MQSNHNENGSVREAQLTGKIERKIPEFEPLLDTDEAARLLRIHPKTLQRLARNGKIRGIKIGKFWRFRISQLNEWMESLTRT